MNISTHTYKETQKKRDKAIVCLARPTNREKKDDNNSKKKRERESDDHAHTHTHAHIKNGTRDEVREKWWLNNEQKIHKNSLI